MAKMNREKIKTEAYERAALLLDKGIDLIERKMFVGVPYMEHNVDNDVNFPLLANFSAGLHALAYLYVPPSDGPGKDHIDIEFASYGGDLDTSLGIYDRICGVVNSANPIPVHMYVFGPCMSGGSLILQAATKRYLSPNSQLMLHYGFTGDEGTSDPTRTREVYRAHVERMNRMIQVYSSRCDPEKLPKSKLRKILKIETYINAQRGVEWGLADGIIGASAV